MVTVVSFFVLSFLTSLTTFSVKSPTRYTFCCCSPFSSHFFKISLNPILPPHFRSSSPPFSSTFWASDLFITNFFPHDRQMSTYSSPSSSLNFPSFQSSILLSSAVFSPKILLIRCFRKSTLSSVISLVYKSLVSAGISHEVSIYYTTNFHYEKRLYGFVEHLWVTSMRFAGKVYFKDGQYQNVVLYMESVW